MDALINIKKASQSLDVLETAIRNKGWADLNKAQLVEELKNVETECKHFYGELKKASDKTKESVSIDHINIDDYFNEIRKTLEILRRNIEMEENATEKTPFNFANIFERESIPELYNELQQKMFSILLKGRFILERLEIAAKRLDTAELEKKPLARRLLDTLEEKDEELRKIKNDYEQLKAKSFLGLVKEQTVAELELKLNEKNAELERRIADFNHTYRDIIKRIILIQNELVHLSREKNVIEYILNNYMRNSKEIIMELKKERDYCNKVLMEIENESLKLREKYLTNLLNIEKDKVAIKNEVEQNYNEKINVLRQKLLEKEELIAHLRKINARNESQQKMTNTVELRSDKRFKNKKTKKK